MANSTNTTVNPTPASDTVVAGQFVKFLTADGLPPHRGSYGGSTWPLPTTDANGMTIPGDWTSVESRIKLCESGWHVATVEGVLEWLNERAFEARIAGKTAGGISGGDRSKICANQGQLVREYTAWRNPSTRILLAAQFLKLATEAWVRSDADAAILDNVVQAVTAFSADPTGDAGAVNSAVAALRNYASTYTGYNAKKPITSTVSNIATTVSNLSYICTPTPGLSNIAQLGRYITSVLVTVAHQDNINARKTDDTLAKWSSTDATNAELAALNTVGSLFISVASGGVPVVISPEYQKTLTARKLVALKGTIDSAKKNIATQAATIASAQRTITAAEASTEASNATIAASEASQASLTMELLNLYGGNVTEMMRTVVAVR